MMKSKAVWCIPNPKKKSTKLSPKKKAAAWSKRRSKVGA